MNRADKIKRKNTLTFEPESATISKVRRVRSCDRLKQAEYPLSPCGAGWQAFKILIFGIRWNVDRICMEA